MKKQITTITLGILMLASAMAVCDIEYSGENCSFPTNLTSPVYTVTGNTYNLTGLTVEFEKPIITISTVVNYKPDNFTMLFFDNITTEVIKEVNVGGGGSSSSSTKYVDKNVTVYIPLYKNITQEVEVEKIVDNTIVVENGYDLWMVLLGMALGIGFGWYITKQEKKSDVKKTD